MDSTEILRSLSQPFVIGDVDFKPQVLRADKTSAMGVAYIDARAVGGRLDEALPLLWSTEYVTVHETQERFVVECRLSLTIDGATITRADVGESDNGEREASRHKSAYSDALKRAAVHFGIGRYLYALPQVWADYDAQKKGWTSQGLQKLRTSYERAIAVSISTRTSAPPNRQMDAAEPAKSASGVVVALNRELTDRYEFKATEREQKLSFIRWAGKLAHLSSSKDLTDEQARSLLKRLQDAEPSEVLEKWQEAENARAAS